MYDKGFIYLHRKLLRNPIVCKDADYLAVWTWLLLNVVWDSAEVMFGGKKITLKAGQITTGRRVIASALKISESKVQRILKAFENEHQIEQRTDRQCRLITIVSWNEYQEGEQGIEQRLNNERTTSEQRVNTKKERKKEIKKEGNKDIYKDCPPELQKALHDFEEMRKSIKKPMTNKARTLLLNQLDKLAGDDTALKVELLEQSILNSWQGVYPLKKQSASAGNKGVSNERLDELLDEWAKKGD